MRKKPVFILFVLLLLVSCSSAPKRPAEIYTLWNMTETQLELANRAADQGRYAQALELLAEARKLATSSDRPKLRIRTWLSEGNVYYYLGRAQDADAAWNAALREAETSGETELAALSRVYMARSRLPGGGERAASEVKSRVSGEMPAIKTRLYTALAWTVIGLAEKESRRWNDAERAFKNALEIHEKDRYLELAAYDWYLIASVRSVTGQYPQALDALNLALSFDRRAENSHGLGMDWLAIGDVHNKAGNRTGAQEAWRRSAAIFRSIDMEANADEAEARYR